MYKIKKYEYYLIISLIDNINILLNLYISI